MNETSSNGSDITLVQDSQCLNMEGCDSNRVKENESKTDSSGKRKSTGPRTQRGKDRSRNNALKYGILSKAVVLPGESRAEYENLLNGLVTHLQPIGKLEETLVEKLAVDWWRYRRFLLAEGAEVRAAGDFVQWEYQERNRQGAANLPMLSCNGGLIRFIANPDVLGGCIRLLKDLRDAIEDCGFRPESDKVTLTRVYGDCRDETWQHTLFRSYLGLSRVAAMPKEQIKERELPSPEACKQAFLEELDEEIKRVERHQKRQSTVFSAKLELESLRRGVPEGPQLDRLLRYSAAISRDIERSLNQLERLQRMRAGQAVPPPINVNVSGSND